MLKVESCFHEGDENSNRNSIEQVQLSLSSEIDLGSFSFFPLGWKSGRKWTLLFSYSVCARTRYRGFRFAGRDESVQPVERENVVSFIPLLHLLSVLCNPLQVPVQVENCSLSRANIIRSFLKQLKIRVTRMQRMCV